MGRVDAFVQSTDKNFLVPVGGCVIASHVAVGENQIWLVVNNKLCMPGLSQGGINPEE